MNYVKYIINIYIYLFMYSYIFNILTKYAVHIFHCNFYFIKKLRCYASEKCLSHGSYSIFSQYFAHAALETLVAVFSLVF